METDPTYSAAHNNLGAALGLLGDLAGEFDQYLRAIELDGSYLDARFNLAITFLALEDLDAAQPLLETLSVDDPDNGIVWRELGRIYALQARIPESEAAYERAESLGQ